MPNFHIQPSWPHIEPFWSMAQEGVPVNGDVMWQLGGDNLSNIRARGRMNSYATPESIGLQGELTLPNPYGVQMFQPINLRIDLRIDDIRIKMEEAGPLWIRDAVFTLETMVAGAERRESFENVAGFNQGNFWMPLLEPTGWRVAVWLYLPLTPQFAETTQMVVVRPHSP